MSIIRNSKIFYLISFQYDCKVTKPGIQKPEKPIDENDDLAYLLPNKEVGFYASNYGELAIPEYEIFLKDKKEEIKEKSRKSNQGRKKKNVNKKMPKPDGNTQKEFSSSIMFGVLAPEYDTSVVTTGKYLDKDFIYKIKLYRCCSGNIPGLKTNDPNYIKAIIDRLFRFINECFAKNGKYIELYYVSYEIILVNVFSQMPIPKFRHPHLVLAYNIYNLSNYISNQTTPEDWNATKFVVEYPDDNAHLIVHIIKDKKSIIKIFPEGKIAFIGNKKLESCMEIMESFENVMIKLLEMNVGRILQFSIPKREKNKKVNELYPDHGLQIIFEPNNDQWCRLVPRQRIDTQ